MKMTVSEFCKYNHFGHCKYGLQCKKKHINETCPTFQCQVEDCGLRHPRLCKFFFQYGRCKFGLECSYFHLSLNTHSSFDKDIEELKSEIARLEGKVLELDNFISTLKEKEKTVKILYSNKCDICDYEASSKAVLKRHKTMKHKKKETIEAPVQPTLPCIGQLDGCIAVVKSYFSESTAICPSCKDKLDQKLKSIPQLSTLCPCCRKNSNSGEPFSFCEDCKNEIVDDGILDSPYGTWHLDRDANEIICTHLDL
jgi:hypothetical protein